MSRPRPWPQGRSPSRAGPLHARVGRARWDLGIAHPVHPATLSPWRAPTSASFPKSGSTGATSRAKVAEHLRGAKPRRHRDHFGTALAEAEPMHGAGGEMNKRTRRCRRRLVTDAEIDLAVDDKKRLVPRMAMRWRATALGPTLQEDLIALRRFARCEHGDMFADDVERRRVIL